MKEEINYRALAEQIVFERLITEVYPTGIVSIVSDTFDLWEVLTKTIPKLKDKILARNGGPESLDKVVIRPDSGDPVDIICGDSSSDNPNAKKGVVEILWDIFGGTTTEQGFKVLNPAIGAIYGDAITIDRCRQICERLRAKGFATTNVVFGIGSYTYQYLTRDSLGFAMKATSVTIDGKMQDIFKDPVTDDGTKKSLKGRCEVVEENGELVTFDTNNPRNSKSPDLLTDIYVDGKFVKEVSLAEIRERIK